MSHQAKEYENLFLQTYATSWLPNIWQVIYQEGIRQNHILFDEEDVQRFEHSKLSHLVLNRPHNEDIMLKLLSLGSLGEMRAYVSQQSIGDRHKIYMIYRQLLKTWRDYVRINLN